MSTEQTANIDETVIEALRAQSRRYDVAIDGELVLSVLPNGVKTWTWVYDDPSDPHRKTLGIYPDMSLEDARKSLAAEKRSYSRTGSQEPEFVIRDGRIQPVAPSSQWPIIVGAAAALIAVMIVAYLVLSGGTDNATVDTMDDSPFSTSPSATDIQLPTLSEPPAAENNADSFAANTTSVDRSDELAAGFPTTVIDTPAPNSTNSQDVASLANKLDQRLSELPQTQPAGTTDDTTANYTSATGVDTASESDLPTAVPQNYPTASSENRPATAMQDPAPDDNLPPAAVQDIAPTQNDNFLASPPQRPAAINNDNPVTVGSFVENTSAELILDSRVARGYLTSAVVSREPVDDLGSALIGTGEDWQTFYFFTELRSLSGQRVRHRWLYRDQIVAEVPFNVGEAWRWRVYSSKTFIPSMSGQWYVQVVLDDDTVIYNLPFSFTAAP